MRRLAGQTAQSATVPDRLDRDAVAATTTSCFKPMRLSCRSRIEDELVADATPTAKADTDPDAPE